MTLPVLDSFCRAFPDVELTLLTSKPGAAIAQAIIREANFAVIAINKKDYSGLSGLNRLYHEMKAQHFDAIADLHDVLRTKWLCLRFRLAGCPVRVIDKGRKQKKLLVSHKISSQLTDGSTRYANVLHALGFDFQVNYSGQGHRLSHEAIPSSIGIAPFAQHCGKIYPLDKMEQVVTQLLNARPDLRIFLFGGPDDASRLQPWADACPTQITNVAGRQTFAEDLALMSRLSLMVSMDSANMHLASLVGLRCLSIWGATHRFAGFLGYGQQEADCLELPLPCRPCSIYGNKPCQKGDYPCLNGLTPEAVAHAILLRI